MAASRAEPAGTVVLVCVMSGWTRDMVVRLVRLEAEGRSFGAIARELGPPFSRSACIGKFHRLADTGDLARLRRQLGIEPRPALPCIASPALSRLAVVGLVPLPRSPRCATPGCTRTRQPYSGRGLCAECTRDLLTAERAARRAAAEPYQPEETEDPESTDGASKGEAA